jgi:ACT domain-containing protein
MLTTNKKSRRAKFYLVQAKLKRKTGTNLCIKNVTRNNKKKSKRNVTTQVELGFFTYYKIKNSTKTYIDRTRI